MEIDLPFEIEYDTQDAVPIDQVIQSLIAVKLLIEEGGVTLPNYVSGVQVERIEVRVRRISQESPLKEILAVAAFLAFQDDLEREVPAMIEMVAGTPVSEEFRTIFTLAVVVALFYGLCTVKDLVMTTATNSQLKRKYDALVRELSEKAGKPEDDIRKCLDERYKSKSRLSTLSSAAIKFFRPSKSQRDAPVRINDQKIESETISEIPAEYAYEEALDDEVWREHSNVMLELHAKDRDRESVGWAAIPEGITAKRLRMRLLDGVSPSQLWGKDRVRGQIMVKYKREGTELVPVEIHLTGLDESV